MSFSLDPLPYDKRALEPNISAKTLDFHYGKHHHTYLNNLNGLLFDKPHPLSAKTLREVITAASKDESLKAVFNNSAQVWNHTFFWNSMKPNGGGMPAGELASKIDADFGSHEEFVNQFRQAGTAVFGSGYAWLVLERDVLKVKKFANADTPVTTTDVPLLTIDVWEHAYYLDYQNRRPDFINVFLEKLVNWDFVSSNLQKAPNKL